MTRLQNIKTKIFLDGGDPAETKEAIKLLGFLDGQTTNPTLISKNPYAKERVERGERFGRKEIFDFYRKVVGDISRLIPEGSVSVEVYADQKTTGEEMLKRGREMFRWIPNAHIKFPITQEGLKAAELAVKGQVFVSPFVGRLDDQRENGMDLIGNIIEMYKNGDGYVEVLTASVRNFDHFLYAIRLGSDIITSPFKILKEWAAHSEGGQASPVGRADKRMLVPADDYKYNASDLKPISYKEIDLRKNWNEYDIRHKLTDKGIERFSADWNALVA